jgi:NADP-dependent 3-hydroxy acid dehydrogenase YdfG
MLAGGTSGVGESTCREFVRNTRQQTVYIIGQSQKKASNLVAGLRAINSEARVTFLQSDLTLLVNVDSVCREILAKENVVNLLFLSAGFLSMNGRVGATNRYIQVNNYLKLLTLTSKRHRKAWTACSVSNTTLACVSS